MWVGAWGSIDTLIEMSTEVPLYRLGLYGSILVLGTIGVWFQLADWRKTQEELDDDFTV